MIKSTHFEYLHSGLCCMICQQTGYCNIYNKENILLTSMMVCNALYMYQQVNVPDIPIDEIYPSPHPNLVRRNDIYQPWKYKDVVHHVLKVGLQYILCFD